TLAEADAISCRAVLDFGNDDAFLLIEMHLVRHGRRHIDERDPGERRAPAWADGIARRNLRRRPELDRENLVLAPAVDGDGGLARPPLQRETPAEGVRIVYHTSVHLEDHVARLEAALFGGAALADGCDEGPRRRIDAEALGDVAADLLQRRAEIGPLHRL